MDGESLTWFILLLRYAVIALVILVLVVAPASFALGYHIAKVREYYRGMYDACRQGYNTTIQNCLMGVRGAYDQKYHRQPSPGWPGWPLPEFTAQDEE